MKFFNYVVSLLSVLLFCLNAQIQTAFADDPVLAGRGQDLFMIVNPNDENSLRIAEAYKQLRNIPDNNILMLVPPEIEGFTRLNVPANQFLQSYIATIFLEIQNRGLSDQIDFIAAVGQPHSFNDPNFNFQSLSFGFMQLDQYFAGMTVAEGQRQLNSIAFGPVGALHHSETERYVGGFVGITSQFGNSADQVIAGLRRSVAADGTKPQGTIYFEENDNIRSNTREFQWNAAQAQLADRNIPFLVESNTPGATPQNRNDVRGAVIGSDAAVAPNGSTYLPGSWVDNLTSFGGALTSSAQTKATDFIATGAAATSGTVAEPTANASRFPSAEIFTHIDLGLTLGEAYYHAVRDPDMGQFIGDVLAQPYADIPVVSLTTDPELTNVFGFIAIDAVAHIPSVGTPVNRLELYVDGLLHDTLTGDSGRFDFDTTQLSDGVAEFRVIAVADNAAETEGISIRRLQIDNLGRSIAAAQQFYQGSQLGSIQVQLAAVEGVGGTIDRVELRHLGNQVALAAGASASIDLGQLAFGENTVTPVAIFDDGQEVQGPSFVVNRTPQLLPGEIVPAISEQTLGIRAEYFFGGGTTSIDTSDFSGTPDIDTIHDNVDLADNANFATFATSDDSELNNLAIRLTGSFSVDSNNVGEYVWSAIGTNDSLRLLVDGHEILYYDNLPAGLDRADGSTSIFLGTGRHDFEILYVNTPGGDGPILNIVLRGPDGITRTLNDEFAFTSTLGDFDADGDVDGDDVDFYIGNLDQPATGDLTQLDLDGDGNVTLADHDLHVTTLVVTSNGVTGALRGDVNLDGTVSVLSDAFGLVGSLGQSVTSRSEGDLNADGVVNVLGDAFILVSQLGQSNEP